MPTEADDSTKSVALALQRVFHDLQFLDKVRYFRQYERCVKYIQRGLGLFITIGFLSRTAKIHIFSYFRLLVQKS